MRIGTAPADRRECFERLFEEHFRTVSGYARRRATASEADDVVAETFLIAWRRLEDVPTEAKPWLLGVARRVLANQHRSTARRAALAERIAQEHAAAPERDVAPILAALARLSTGDREVLLMTAWDGLSGDEMAAALDCSRAAAKVRLYRAKRRLRSEFERLDSAEPVQTASRRLEECHDE